MTRIITTGIFRAIVILVGDNGHKWFLNSDNKDIKIDLSRHIKSGMGDLVGVQAHALYQSGFISCWKLQGLYAATNCNHDDLQ